MIDKTSFFNQYRTIDDLVTDYLDNITIGVRDEDGKVEELEVNGCFETETIFNLIVKGKSGKITYSYITTEDNIADQAKRLYELDWKRKD